MLHTKIIDASIEKIDILKAEEFLSSSNFGALIYFVGTVRDLNENKKVTGITYDSRDSMVLKSFEEIYKDAELKLKIKDKAVKACSPPDNKVIDCNLFPGGLTNISNPASKGSSESTSSSFALPPLNSLV